MANEKPTLKERVQQFQTLNLPGQPMGMHMGTSHLVTDLWRSHQELLEALTSCRDACLFDDDDGMIGVTLDPHIDGDLFDRICIAINRATGVGKVD